MIHENIQKIIDKSVPYRIEGIPEGHSVFMDTERKIGSGMIIKGYLIAWKEDTSIMASKPIVYPENASQKEIDTEFESQGKILSILYKQL